MMDFKKKIKVRKPKKPKMMPGMMMPAAKPPKMGKKLKYE